MQRLVTRTSVLPLAALLLCAPVQAEWIPPPKIEDLLKADFIAVGHFAEGRDGTLSFVGEEELKGRMSVAKELCGSGKLRIRRGPDGSLTYHSAAVGARFLSTGGTAPVDARKRRLWFFFKRSSLFLECQPAAFAEGYRSLLAGRKPSPVFCLLQALSPDMRRQELEELVAEREREVIRRLHELAEKGSSEVALAAVSVLSETRLLEGDRFWGKWLGHSAEYWLQQALRSRDAERFLKELTQAIEREDSPSKLSQLLWDLRQYPRSVYIDISLRYLDHVSAQVRRRVVGTLWDTFWVLGAERRKSQTAQAEFEALSVRVVPLLRKRLQVEKDGGVRNSITKILARKDELPLVEHLPPWSETEELKFLLDRLTSHGERGFVMESAGREIVRYHFDKGFAEMRKRLGQEDVYNTDMVLDGMGYLSDPRCMAFLVEYAKTIGVGHRNFRSCLVALARQNSKNSYGAVVRVKTETLDPLGDDYKAQWLFNALGEVRDRKAYSMLMELRSHANYHGRLAFVRALAKHGDQWATKELIQGLHDLGECEILKEGWASRTDTAKALTFVDSDKATEALKEYVADTWPEATREPFHSAAHGAVRMQNYAGPRRRTAPLGEVARRDPQWLAGLALQKMASDSLAARQMAHGVFLQLTGRSFAFRPEAFAHERHEPLERLRAWWRDNRTQSREEWLLSYFEEKGVHMERLNDKSSIPLLCKALEGDFFTHNLALEQISAIAQKYFTRFRLQASYRGQEKMNIRALGWLKARGYLPETAD